MLIHLLGSDSIKAKLLLCRWLEHTDDGGGHTMEGKRGPSLQIVDHHLAPGLRWLSKHCLHCSFILGVFLSLFIFFFSFYLSLLCLLFLSRPLSLCRLYLPIWGPEMGNLSQLFFANLTNYMSPDGEFRCCHRVLGVFCSQIHVFWGPMGSREFPQFVKTQKMAFFVA